MNILRRGQGATGQSVGELKNRKKAVVLENFFLGKEWNEIQRVKLDTKLCSKGRKKNWVIAALGYGVDGILFLWRGGGYVQS